MAGVVLETLSNRKLAILSVFLILVLIAFFLIGGLIAPAPNSVIPSTAFVCIDTENIWRKNMKKPFIPPRNSQANGSPCKTAHSVHAPEIFEDRVDPNQIVFSQWFPLPKDNHQLRMSRWFQNLIAVLDVDILYSEKNPYPEDGEPEMTLEISLYASDHNDSQWKLYAESTETRTLDCQIDPDKRQEGYKYNCELLPLFELGSVHYHYYLINIRFPVSAKKEMNNIGEVDDIHIIAIFQNGGFTKVWFAMKTVFFPAVLAILIWFWRRVMTQGRSTNLTERTLFALGIILTIMNCPIEWLTLVMDIPCMMLLNDIRDGAFYGMLFSFWLIFIGEHEMDQVEKNKLSAYWKHLTVVILACSALFIFDMCERGTQLVNPFHSIWYGQPGAVVAFAFIIIAGIAACVYFVFLCYSVFKVFRNIRAKHNSLLHMTSFRRKYYSGLIFRFKFLMIVTLLCAALTVIAFIIGQVSEGQWKWGEEELGLEYSSAFLTGVYGMWNVYVIALLCLFAPSHKYLSSETDDTDSNSREEEVQLTQIPSEASSLSTFIAKPATD